MCRMIVLACLAAVAWVTLAGPTVCLADGGLASSSFVPCDAPAGSSAERAVQVAQGWIAAPLDTPTQVQYGVATDPSTPFFTIADRPVWQVVFSDLRLAIRQKDGSIAESPNITTLTCWVDAESGALLKAFSPTPAVDGSGPSKLASLIADSAGSYELVPTPTRPAVALVNALEKGGGRILGQLAQVTQVVVYYGLVTNRFPAFRIPDDPCWLVFVDGVELPMPFVGLKTQVEDPEAPSRVATTALRAINATDGRYRGGRYRN